MGTVANDPELTETNRALVGIYRRLRNARATASSGQPVFDPLERGGLSLHKYIRGTEDLGKTGGYRSPGGTPAVLAPCTENRTGLWAFYGTSPDGRCPQCVGVHSRQPVHW
jgi:hypothetical protein